MYPTTPADRLPERTTRDIESRKLVVPMIRTTGYCPLALNLTLTPRQARVLANIAEALRIAGKRINHPADAIGHLLDAIAD